MSAATNTPVVREETITVDGIDLFVRSAGDPAKPAILLLHGFPTSSHMFRELIPHLARDFHVIAPDYPGFGRSAMPDREAFDYTFDRFSELVEGVIAQKGLERYALYLMDYGAPVGYRVFANHPERVSAFLVQNGNAYEEGLSAFWEPIKAYWATGAQGERDALRDFLSLESTKWQYTHGTRDPDSISPANWETDQPLLDRPGNQEIQLDLFYDYGSNPPRYPEWQRLFREQQVPTLITWGRHDEIFPESGAHPYLRDLPDAELHILETGHFALEEEGERIADLITDFMQTKAR